MSQASIYNTGNVTASTFGGGPFTRLLLLYYIQSFKHNSRLTLNNFTSLYMYEISWYFYEYLINFHKLLWMQGHAIYICMYVATSLTI